MYKVNFLLYCYKSLIPYFFTRKYKQRETISLPILIIDFLLIKKLFILKYIKKNFTANSLGK